jgi:hypothetical protein
MIELRRPPQVPRLASPLVALVVLAMVCYHVATPLTQAVQGLQPSGAWQVRVGDQRFAVRVGQQPVGQGTPLPTYPPTGYELTTEAELWAYDLAARLGNPAPSFETIMFLVAWQAGEGTSAQFNPLATTQPMQGATCFNSLPSMPCGVKNYPSREDGLQATIETLRAGHTGYADIEAGIVSNDPERALRGLHVAPWGTSASLVEQLYRQRVGVVEQLVISRSVPISVDRSTAFGWNVAQALDANGRALRDVVIQPGQTWSFNASVGNPTMDLESVAGVPGGGWCDLASRYVQAARPLLPTDAFTFINHVDNTGWPLADVAYADSVVIWNIGGVAGFEGGRQDLLITNTLNQPIRLRAVESGSVVTIEGGVQ